MQLFNKLPPDGWMKKSMLFFGVIPERALFQILHFIFILSLRGFP